MDALKRVQLRIVATEQVHPHEIADPAREQKIERRLQVDGVLRDPLTVGIVPDIEGYVLLDGTNRRQALAALGCPSVMVQLIDYADPHAIQLRTWCHTAALPLSELLPTASAIPGTVVAPLPPLATPDALLDSGTLAVVLDRHERYALTRALGHEGSRIEQLRQLVDIYEDCMVRVDCEPDEVEERAHMLSKGDDSQVLVTFPHFSRSQVVSMALGGALIPAGITRHIVLCGRALRVNIPLGLLQDSQSLEDANVALQHHINSLHPRAYGEPTILFDS